MKKLLTILLMTGLLWACDSENTEDPFAELPWAAELLATYTEDTDERKWRFYSGTNEGRSYYYFSFCCVNCVTLPPKVYSRTGEEVEISHIDLENIALIWQPKDPGC